MLNPFPRYEDKWRLKKKKVISKDNKEYKINTHTPWQNNQTNKSLYVYSLCVKSRKEEKHEKRKKRLVRDNNATSGERVKNKGTRQGFF